MIFLMAGAAAGGFINGLAGFGTSLFAMGFLLSAMTPVEAVAITVVIAVATGLQGLWVVRKTVGAQRHRIARFLIPALVGIPLGTALLGLLEPRELKLFVAAMMILYGGYFSLRRSLPQVSRPLHSVDVTIGFVGGVMGGAAALSGVLPTMWCAMRGWPKAETRSVLQPFNLATLGITAMVLTFRGAYDRETLLQLAVAIPVAMVAARIGIALFKRLGDQAFRRLLIGLCFVSGAALLVMNL